MPNKQSAMKELRKSKKRTAHNLRIKAHVKALFNKSKDLMAKGKMEDAKKVMVLFQQATDKAAKNKVISKNKSQRKKSSLMKSIMKPAITK